ncbi:MAG: hypothetical protein ABI602_04215 [Candidatus Saccharibacteria bacterium]
MTVTALPNSGNSSKFLVAVAKRGEFVVALSSTLCHSIWKLADAAAELDAGQQVAEALVSRHDPKLPFKKVYVFGEHNTEPTLQGAVKYLRRFQI